MLSIVAPTQKKDLHLSPVGVKIFASISTSLPTIRYINIYSTNVNYIHGAGLCSGKESRSEGYGLNPEFPLQPVEILEQYDP